MKVIFINAYPMDIALKQWKKGLYPGHHLWGVNEIEKRGKMFFKVLKHEKYKWLNRLGSLFDIEHFDQQIRTIWELRQNDAIYAPYAGENTKLIIILKALGLIRKPVIIVIHQPLLKYNTDNKILRVVVKNLILKYDAIIFLSRELKRDMEDKLEVSQKVAERKFFHLNWGPEVNFYKNYSNPKHPQNTTFAISAGHTGRDFDTLVEAFRIIDFPLKIFCTPKSSPSITNIPSNVTIISNEKLLPYTELLKEYDNARVILVPLQPQPKGTEGLTSLLDVLGMAKPIIMTQNDKVDIDVEKEGIGLTVGTGDIQDWIRSLNTVLFNDQLLLEMQKNCLRLMHSVYNLDCFSKGLENIINDTVKREKL
ncbi:MAG: hypothetical protein WBG71_03870 [Leeuwenhoekiella sp.]